MYFFIIMFLLFLLSILIFSLLFLLTDIVIINNYVVSPTNTLKDCLMENQINQRLFLNRRLNIISPQTTNPQQQLLSPGKPSTNYVFLTHVIYEFKYLYMML